MGRLLRRLPDPLTVTLGLVLAALLVGITVWFFRQEPAPGPPYACPLFDATKRDCLQ